MHTFAGLERLTEIKIQILCDHVDHTRFHIVEMGCQMIQLLSAQIVGPTMFVNLTPAKDNFLMFAIKHLIQRQLEACKSLNGSPDTCQVTDTIFQN